MPNREIFKIMEEFFKDKKVLIADPGAASRASLYNIIKNMGAKPQNISLSSDYASAEESIENIKPEVVIADYDLGPKCGLELLRIQREKHPKETKNCLFIVVTANSSQSAVARSCEEDIDAFALKPYTMEGLRGIITKAALQKIEPSGYQIAIDAGRDLLEKTDLNGAEAQFKKAVGLSPTPTTALYFLGLIEFTRKALEKSKSNYLEGLAYNKIHYRCMVGLYELLIAQNSHQEAYEVVKKISQYFPANPKRLAEVLRLAIQTQQFEDIERYYAVFTSLDHRDETLIRYICAALIICGKYYLSSNLGKSRARELFQKAAVIAGERTKILREIIFTLTDNGLMKDAEVFLKRFPPSYQGSEDFELLVYLVSQSDPNAFPTPELGQRLILKGIVDERLYKSIAQGFIKKKDKESAENIMYDAIKKLPERKAVFEAVLKEIKDS